MGNNLSSKKVPVLIIILTSVVFLIYYLLVTINSALIIENLFSIGINNHARFNSIVSRTATASFILYILIIAFYYLNKTSFIERIKEIFTKLTNKLLLILSLKTLLVFSIFYLAILFYLAIKNYDLGFDEAWWLSFAKNFSNYWFAFDTHNGKISIVDNLTMLPMLMFSTINFQLGLTEVWHIKFLSSAISIVSILICFFIIKKLYNLNISIIFLFLLIIQPGFGFVASSFFSEILQASFFFAAVYIWFKDNIISFKKTLLISFLFALTIHSKFQLLLIIIATFIIFHFYEKNKKTLTILLLTLILTFILSALRTIPILLYDKSLLINLFKWYYGNFFSETNWILLIDRTQLFNRFIPLILITTILSLVYPRLKNSFEKFIFTFTCIAFLWWIFLFHLSTYRHLFVAIIPFSFLFSIFLYDHYKKNISESSKNYVLRYIVIFSIFILTLYGFSANIIYAYIGYNDGVQFDLDGNRNRLFHSIKQDFSQKEFYREMKRYLGETDTIYMGSYVTQFYLSNPVFDYNELQKLLDKEKYVIISRELFPLGLEKGYQLLDSLHLRRKLLLKTGDFELYSVTK